MHTKEAILVHTAHLLAHDGVAGTSMRKVAAAVGKEASVIYSHFSDKESLLRATRVYITKELDEKLLKLNTEASASAQLESSIRFQLTHRKRIVALLQYFMAMREDFVKNENGYVPSRAYAHMSEIISRGRDEGMYTSHNIAFDAKLVTHMINGFLMEYFDRDLSRAEFNTLVSLLCRFIERGLGKHHA